MSAAPTIDRTLKSPGKFRAIATKKGSQCDRIPYRGDDEINPRFCYVHRNPQSRKSGEVDDPSTTAQITAATQASTRPQVQVVIRNIDEDTNLYRPSYYPSATENEEDTNMYPSPLQVSAQFQGSDISPSQPQELNNHPQSQIDGYSTPQQDTGFAFNPISQTHPQSQIDSYPTPQQETGFAFNPTSQTDTRFALNSQSRLHQFEQEPRSPPNLEAVMAQLTRMELQSREDVRRIDINYKSKVEDLETRVQHLERAQIPGNQAPIDQISRNDISKTMRIFEEHLVDIQQQYNINDDKRNEAKLRATSLHRKSEAAHRAYAVALQRYHEKEQEYTLRNQQGRHLKGIEQKMMERIQSLRNGAGPEPGPEPEPDNMEA